MYIFNMPEMGLWLILQFYNQSLMYIHYWVLWVGEGGGAVAYGVTPSELRGPTNKLYYKFILLILKALIIET